MYVDIFGSIRVSKWKVVVSKRKWKGKKKKSNKEGKGKYEIEDKNMFEATLKGQNGESRNAVTNQIARLVVPL